MGTYNFKWTKPAGEVYVTGTFDNWAKTEKLEKVGDGFEKTVALPDSSEKILYKFVVDGEWVVEDAHPKEKDSNGIDNNVLTPEEIVKAAPATTAIMSSVGPDATTVKLAADAPLATPSDIPGGFPETPANDLDKQVSVNPLPAAPGAVNPIKLAPGEKVPGNIAGDDINSHVKLDQESYEKADTLPAGTVLPPVGKNMIPESSLPVVGAGDDVTINTVGPGATTVGLAGKVPLEPKVPDVVKESQQKAGFDPEASAVPEELREKAEVEAELLKKVSEAPSTAEGTSGKGTEKAESDKPITETIAATVTGLGAAAVATALATKDKAVEQASVAAKDLPVSVKQVLPVSAQEAVASSSKEEVRQEVSPEVPAEVKESIQEAGTSPEAAVNTEAVEEKKAVEAELLKEVKPVGAAGESSKKAETNGTETTKAPETPAKASASKPEAKAAESPATTEKKKKNRLSLMFTKLKQKVSSKDKA